MLCFGGKQAKQRFGGQEGEDFEPPGVRLTSVAVLGPSAMLSLMLLWVTAQGSGKGPHSPHPALPTSPITAGAAGSPGVLEQLGMKSWGDPRDKDGGENAPPTSTELLFAIRKEEMLGA